MGILHEIGAVVKGLCKQAQWEYQYYNSGLKPDIHAKAQNLDEHTGKKDALNWMRAARGVMRGARDFVPSMIDYTVGVGSGAVNGAYHALTGRKFYDGWKKSRGFTKRYMSEPTRRAEMFYVGDAARNMVDDKIKNQEDTLRTVLDKDKADAIIRGSRDIVEPFSKGVTDVALAIPGFMGLYRHGLAPFQAISKGLSATPLPRMAAGLYRRIAPLSAMARKALAPVSRSKVVGKATSAIGKMIGRAPNKVDALDFASILADQRMEDIHRDKTEGLARLDRAKKEMEVQMKDPAKVAMMINMLKDPELPERQKAIIKRLLYGSE